ncbi:MAG: hypothetical protein SEPTF4163_003037 [Sporothrix epigloea]
MDATNMLSVADNEKQLCATESTKFALESTSQTSLLSAMAGLTTSSSSDSSKITFNEKAGRSSTSIPEALPRTSDLSTPATVHHNPFDTDIEAMITYSTTEGTLKYNDINGRRSMGCRGLSESQVWPGQGHWKRKAREQRMNRSCSCLSQLSKRNRLIVNLLIGLLIVGAAVGIGLGISKPLGAAIWGQHHS